MAWYSTNFKVLFQCYASHFILLMCNFGLIMFANYCVWSQWVISIENMLLKIIKININIITWTLFTITFISQLVKLKKQSGNESCWHWVLSSQVMTPSIFIDFILYTDMFPGPFLVTIICSLLPEEASSFDWERENLTKYWSLKIMTPGRVVAKMDLKYKLIGRNKTRY